MYKTIASLFFLLLIAAVTPVQSASVVSDGAQTTVSKTPPAPVKPMIVIYTLSTCPHCREAKEYLTQNNIPFVNREVDTDSQHMDELMAIYDKMAVPDEKRGVPLLLIGETVKIQGFNKKKVQEALKNYLP